MRFPLAVIDFEASSLSMESYPIEVGLAVARGSNGPIKVWSKLIRPTADWIGRGDWDPEAEQTHKIRMGELQAGMQPLRVAERLNQLLGPIGTAWSDGGVYDGHWLRTLYRAAGTKPAFTLWDIAALFITDRRMHNRYAEILAHSVAGHRAGSDAGRICAALIKSSGTSQRNIEPASQKH